MKIVEKKEKICTKLSNGNLRVDKIITNKYVAVGKQEYLFPYDSWINDLSKGNYNEQELEKLYIELAQATIKFNKVNNEED